MLMTGQGGWFRAMRSLRRFRRGERGVAAVEFALVLPVVLLIMLGCFEIPRLVLIHQKIARTASGVADLVSQADEPLTTDQLRDVYSAARTMMQPYDLKTNGRIIITSINNSAGTGASITWQRANGDLNAASKILSPANLPTGLSPGAGEEVLVAEVYFTYTPVFSSLIYSGSQLYRASYTRPRNDNLITAPAEPTE